VGRTELIPPGAPVSKKSKRRNQEKMFVRTKLACMSKELFSLNLKGCFDFLFFNQIRVDPY
jgi:hypothetical protein